MEGGSLSVYSHRKTRVLERITTPRYRSRRCDDGVEKMAKNQNKMETQQENEQNDTGISSMLVGYARKSNAGGALKLSINTSAMADCETYTTSDGQTYVPLVISLQALLRVIEGERAVTTVSQLQDA